MEISARGAIEISMEIYCLIKKKTGVTEHMESFKI